MHVFVCQGWSKVATVKPRSNKDAAIEWSEKMEWKNAAAGPPTRLVSDGVHFSEGIS